MSLSVPQSTPRSLPQGWAELHTAGVPAYIFPESAARALAAMCRQAEWRARPVDGPELREDILIRLSQLACDYPEIREMGVNPLLAGPAHGVAVDARATLEPPAAATG